MKALSDYGTVEPGKIADLVLRDADPTRTSTALHRIDQVILHGKLLDQAALAALLQNAHAQAQRN
jgi:imidazolonepropionase-like amidohydrolase